MLVVRSYMQCQKNVAFVGSSMSFSSFFWGILSCLKVVVGLG